MGDQEESLADRQENEVEALKAIYDKDFEVRNAHLRVFQSRTYGVRTVLQLKRYNLGLKIFDRVINPPPQVRVVTYSVFNIRMVDGFYLFCNVFQ